MLTEKAITAFNDDGDVALFAPRLGEAQPDSYSLSGRDLVLMAAGTPLGTFTDLGDLAFGAVTKRPERDLLVVEMEQDGTPIRESVAKQVRR